MPENAIAEEQDWVWLARILRPQGRRGEVFAESLTDFPEKFSERKDLTLIHPDGPPQPCPVELAHHWLHKGGIVLHFAGVDSINAAEKLKGLLLAVPRAQRVSLGADEVYIGDLIGCTLVNIAGGNSAQDAPQPVGVIENVDRSAGPVALLIVRRGSDEVLVPFARSYLRELDIAAKRVVMDLPEGLIELNQPTPQHRSE
ncbi:MAG: 16S rRNA processing protein RimM [Acidobacteriota bacterium]|nr:16S rRNA processing protein RimM [Acidobacteriota bacterium]